MVSAAARLECGEQLIPRDRNRYHAHFKRSGLQLAVEIALEHRQGVVGETALLSAIDEVEKLARHDEDTEGPTLEHRVGIVESRLEQIGVGVRQRERRRLLGYNRRRLDRRVGGLPGRFSGLDRAGGWR